MEIHPRCAIQRNRNTAPCHNAHAPQSRRGDQGRKAFSNTRLRGLSAEGTRCCASDPSCSTLHPFHSRNAFCSWTPSQTFISLVDVQYYILSAPRKKLPNWVIGKTARNRWPTGTTIRRSRTLRRHKPHLVQHIVRTPYFGKFPSAVTTVKSFASAVAIMKRSAGSL